VVHIKEVAVAKNQVNDWVLGVVSVSWVAAEGVVHGAPVVLAGWHSAVAVVVRLATGPLKSFDLVPFRMVHKCEVRVAVKADEVILEVHVVQASTHPVLEWNSLSDWLTRWIKIARCMAAQQAARTSAQVEELVVVKILTLLVSR
jgi:hypothetical protein